MKCSVKSCPDPISKCTAFSSDFPLPSSFKMLLPLSELALPHILSVALAVLQTVLEYLFLRLLSFFLGISSTSHISERISSHHFEFPQAYCKTKQITRNCCDDCFSGYVYRWSNVVINNINIVGVSLGTLLPSFPMNIQVFASSDLEYK